VQSDPSELVERPAELASQVGAQFLAGHERLSLCLVARAAQSEDLGAVDPAAPVEAPDGVRFAPPLHRRGPLLGHVILGEALQGAHELAVDDPCRERIEVPGDRRHPGLVEQRQTLLDIAVQDEQPGFCHPSDGACRRVARRTHLDGTPGPLPSAGHVASQHPFVGADNRKPGVRGRLTPTFEKPLRSLQPAAHRCHESGVEQYVHRDAHGCACCRDVVTCLHACRVGALPRLDGRIEMTGRVGDLAKHRKIGGGKETVPVRLHEEVECLLPVLPGCRVTCALDEAKTSAVAHRTPPESMIDRAPGQPAPNVTVGVTAVTVLLTPWDCASRVDATEGDPAMPFINVKLIEGVFDATQKREIVEKLTETMVSIEGENMRSVTWCVIEEVHSGDWGMGGNTLTTADVKSLAAGQPATT
jgi:4-oxalocrotonate tautomerase